jgi:hypothetical protein
MGGLTRARWIKPASCAGHHSLRCNHMARRRRVEDGGPPALATRPPPESFTFVLKASGALRRHCSTRSCCTF